MEFSLLTQQKTVYNLKIRLHVFWRKPPDKWYKLNIDGSFHHANQSGGIGGVFRDSNGDWITEFSGVSPENSPLHAELQALHTGLQIAHQRQLFPLEIEMDCTEVILSLAKRNDAYISLISSCRWLLHKEKNLLIRHNFRQGNQVAHHLAKEAPTLSRSTAVYHFAIPPCFVMLLLDKDKNSTVFATKELDAKYCNILASFSNLNVLMDITSACNSFPP
ncbi:hypothetical protein RND71_003014 [Anisodus tanguticus]|uniref:RNase H type-1 domain-containing protein n=1 Tax=Anisodus tanguticus TaxID=243964 RepID=A0AAE1VN92_9SOLA|nr:hypothetical protein RND71_003014 [Anisodus tanguticus]